jgi:PAS domain S-box-containing protein
MVKGFEIIIFLAGIGIGAFFLYIVFQRVSSRTLDEKEGWYRLLFKHGNDAIFVYGIGEDGLPGSFEEVNDEALIRYGYTREEFLSLSPPDIYDPDSDLDSHDVIKELRKSAHVLFERVHLTRDGRKIPVEISAHLFEYRGTPRIISICRDITKRKAVERKLMEIQEIDEKILDGSPVALVLRDSELKVLRASRAFGTVTGYDSEMVLGKTLEQFMPEGPGRTALQKRLRKVLEEGVQVGPEDFEAPTPVHRHLRETILPVFGPDEEVVNTLSVLEDITTQVVAEQKLRELQEIDEKILEASPVAFVLHDTDLRIVRVSKAYQDVTGFMPDQVVDRRLEDFMPDSPQKRGVIGRLMKVQEYGVQVGPQDIESPIPGRNLRETIIPIFDEKRNVTNTLSVLEDITDRKLAKDALARSEERYRMLFDSISDGVVIHEIHENGRPGAFLDVNSGFRKTVGYSRNELLKMTPLDLESPEEAGDTSRIQKTLQMGGGTFFERKLVSKDGDLVPVEISAQTFKLGNQYLGLSVVRDISERQAAKELITASLAEKEILLREIHHRVKNNLQVISGLLNLQSHYINDESVRSIYKESQNRIKTMALIHEGFYQHDDLARINLAEYMRDLTENLLASYMVKKEAIDLILDIPDIEMNLDTAIPCGLIVNELISNSMKHAFPGKRTGKIGISMAEQGEGYSLTISDDGVGFPEGVHFRKVKSMGMQLVTVLAEQLGGEVRYSGENGTSFTVTFKEYHEAGTEVH